LIPPNSDDHLGSAASSRLGSFARELAAPATASRHHPRKRVIQYSRAPLIDRSAAGVLDTPLEPVIGLAAGETRWRGMTPLAEQRAAPIRWPVMTAGNAGRDCANGYRFAKWQGKPNFALP